MKKLSMGAQKGLGALFMEFLEFYSTFNFSCLFVDVNSPK